MPCRANLFIVTALAATLVYGYYRPPYRPLTGYVQPTLCHLTAQCIYIAHLPPSFALFFFP